MGLVETAKLLAPSIRDASRSAEEHACLPSDLVEVLRDNGCFTALVPAALGGKTLVRSPTINNQFLSKITKDSTAITHQ